MAIGWKQGHRITSRVRSLWRVVIRLAAGQVNGDFGLFSIWFILVRGMWPPAYLAGAWGIVRR